MAQLNKLQNTMSDHPELKRLLESVNLEELFDEEEEEEEKEDKKKNNK